MNNSTQQVKSHLQKELGKMIIGADPYLDLLAIAIVASENLLIAGSPGTGKTQLSKAIMQLLGREPTRIDCGNDIEFTQKNAMNKNTINIIKEVTIDLEILIGHKKTTTYYTSSD